MSKLLLIIIVLFSYNIYAGGVHIGSHIGENAGEAVGEGLNNIANTFGPPANQIANAVADSPKEIKSTSITPSYSVDIKIPSLILAPLLGLFK